MEASEPKYKVLPHLGLEAFIYVVIFTNYIA